MKNLIVMAFGLLLFLSCNSPKEDSTELVNVKETTVDTAAKNRALGGYAHSVYVWLKNPESDKDRAVFEASMKKFAANLPYVTSIHFGKPLPSERDVVDSSYTYSFLITFEQESDLATYAEDPVHLAFKAETSDLWSRVVIYDSVNLLE